MIGYVTLGTNDLPRAAEFYDAIAEQFGVGRMMEFDTFIAWGTMGGAPGVAATKPFDGEEATVGNGTMVALQVESPEKVKAIYDIAMNKGGSDEGAPGPRGDDGF
ncbi:MAG: VOC family protein, partial [Pseudomonadota bacterium]